MRMLEELYPEFTGKLGELDASFFSTIKLDKKTLHFVCLALSIRGRSKPCIFTHFKGALAAGATKEEIASLIALTIREAAGQDDCYIHDILGDWESLMPGDGKCDCAK